MTSYLLRTYWIVRARNRIRRLTHQCIRCTRFRGRLQVQQMAPLPAVRVIPARPFAYTGLDYVGPYLLRASAGRGIKAYKGYLAIFVCMVTRAVHIEVVSDYSIPSFLLAFRRFISRLGLCDAIYSDNGTTFQGSVATAVAADGIQWNFISHEHLISVAYGRPVSKRRSIIYVECWVRQNSRMSNYQRSRRRLKPASIRAL